MEGGADSDRADGSGGDALDKLSSKLSQFLSELKGIKCGQYLLSLVQLCYVDTELARDTWVGLFGRLWGSLTDQQRKVGREGGRREEEGVRW